MALWNEIKQIVVEENSLRYYIFVARWLWNNRRWSNTRQKWKALERDWASHEKERKTRKAKV